MEYYTLQARNATNETVQKAFDNVQSLTLYTHVCTLEAMRKNQIINITLSEELLKAVDKQAEVELRNRSELFREAVRMYLFNKNADKSHQSFTDDESSRVNDIKKFSDFEEYTTFALSCSFRPQPNELEEIFSGRESELIKYIENPKSFRNMGWDLRTLGTATPVAGEYLQITNGDRKIIRVFRDGQIVFAASEDFFGHGVAVEEKEAGTFFRFNSMASAELISNFVNFSLEIAKYLSIDSHGIIYKIRVFNPKRKQLKLTSISGFREDIGELTLDLADREVYLTTDSVSPEKFAYKIWAELNYLFGISEDHFLFVNKANKSIDFNEFADKRK
ncbi:MAG: ribbon-helix-helix domain-containing protein [Candidatus Pacearchaeota archaeon]